MRTLFYALSSCGLLLITAACSEDENDTSAVETQPWIAPASTEPAIKTQDVCALLTKEEIQSVQGSPIREATSSVRADGGLRVAQCFYTAQDYSKSVVLTTTQIAPGPQNPKRNLKELWAKTFHRDFKKEKEGEEEHEWLPPKKIPGVGDEAYWSGGSLYIFTKDSFVRIAIGGPEPEETKIQRLRALAEKAVPRL